MHCAVYEDRDAENVPLGAPEQDVHAPVSAWRLCSCVVGYWILAAACALACA